MEEKSFCLDKAATSATATARLRTLEAWPERADEGGDPPPGRLRGEQRVERPQLARQTPVGVRRAVVEDPGAEEPAVGRRFPADRVEEGAQSEVQPAQIVERDRREVVVLEVIGGEEVPEVPPARGLQHRAPLGRILRPDRVVLPESVQREGDGEDQKVRDQIDAGENTGAAREEKGRHDGYVESDRPPPLSGNPLLKGLRVARRLQARGAEVDREERRG